MHDIINSSIASFIGAAFFAALFFLGLGAGRAMIFWPTPLTRDSKPVGFWTAQLFVAVVALVAMYAGIATLLGWSPP